MKKITNIETIYNIFKKYGDLNLKVNTPYGYKHIEACDITAKNSDVLHVKTESKLDLKCSPNHLIKSVNGRFVKAIDLLPGSSVLTKKGDDKISSIETLPYKEDLYDIQVADVKQYYSNGIVSHNSSIFDALSFCIFDKFSRGYKASSVLNIKKNKFKCKFHFRINNVDYYIERHGKSDKHRNVKVNVEFWKVENDKKTILNGEARRNTNDIIREYLGTYENFILTTLSVQNSKFGSFVDMNQSERKDLICQFMGLDIFDKLHAMSNDILKEKNSILKTKNKEEIKFNISELKNNLNSLINAELKLNESILKEEQLKKLSSDKVVELSKMTESCYDTCIDIGLFESNKIKYQSILKESDIKISNSNNELEKIKNELSKIKSYIPDNMSEIKEGLIKYEDFSKQQESKRSEIEKLKFVVSNKMKTLKMLENHEYDPNCKYCINNEFVKNALDTKESLKKDKILSDKLLMELSNINSNLKDAEKYKLKYEQLLGYKNKIDSLTNSKFKIENEISKFENEKLSITHELEDCSSKINKYYSNLDKIKNNVKLNAEINDIRSKLASIENSLKEKNNKLIEIKSNITRNEINLENLQSEFEKITELENDFLLYKEYVSLVNRDGMPLKIINSILPDLENEVNSILHEIVDFKVLIKTDGKTISTEICYADDKKWPLEMGSGMEKFLSGLAIRVSLIHISNMPRANILCVDEGWGSLDKNNISSIESLFNVLKNKFEFIWVISHLESMKDMVDSHVEIHKTNGFSNVDNR